MVFFFSLNPSMILGDFCVTNMLPECLDIFIGKDYLSHSSSARCSILNLAPWIMSASEAIQAGSQRGPQPPSLPPSQIADWFISFHPYHHFPVTPSSKHYPFFVLLCPFLNWSGWFHFVTNFCPFLYLQYPFYKNANEIIALRTVSKLLNICALVKPISVFLL